MKAKKIYYKRLFNLGNFSNAEIGIELEVEENEKAIDVLKNAKQFIDAFDPNIDIAEKIEKLEHIINNPRNYNYGQVEDAKKELERIQSNKDDDLPF